ncbi:hypothetical protein RCL1_006073 [Eukaryota sp. TZLM3-RCL]
MQNFHISLFSCTIPPIIMNDSQPSDVIITVFDDSALSPVEFNTRLSTRRTAFSLTKTIREPHVSYDPQVTVFEARQSPITTDATKPGLTFADSLLEYKDSNFTRTLPLSSNLIATNITCTHDAVYPKLVSALSTDEIRLYNMTGTVTEGKIKNDQGYNSIIFTFANLLKSGRPIVVSPPSSPDRVCFLVLGQCFVAFNTTAIVDQMRIEPFPLDLSPNVSSALYTIFPLDKFMVELATCSYDRLYFYGNYHIRVYDFSNTLIESRKIKNKVTSMGYCSEGLVYVAGGELFLADERLNAYSLGKLPVQSNDWVLKASPTCDLISVYHIEQIILLKVSTHNKPSCIVYNCDSKFEISTSAPLVVADNYHVLIHYKPDDKFRMMTNVIPRIVFDIPTPELVLPAVTPVPTSSPFSMGVLANDVADSFIQEQDPQHDASVEELGTKFLESLEPAIKMTVESAVQNAVAEAIKQRDLFYSEIMSKFVTTIDGLAAQLVDIKQQFNALQKAQVSTSDATQFNRLGKSLDDVLKNVASSIPHTPPPQRMSADPVWIVIRQMESIAGTPGSVGDVCNKLIDYMLSTPSAHGVPALHTFFTLQSHQLDSSIIIGSSFMGNSERQRKTFEYFYEYLSTGETLRGVDFFNRLAVAIKSNRDTNAEFKTFKKNIAKVLGELRQKFNDRDASIFIDV